MCLCDVCSLGYISSHANSVSSRLTPGRGHIVGGGSNDFRPYDAFCSLRYRTPSAPAIYLRQHGLSDVAQPKENSLGLEGLLVHDPGLHSCQGITKPHDNHPGNLDKSFGMHTTISLFTT